MMSARRRCTKWRASRMRDALVFQRPARKFGIEKTEQAVERLLVAAVRRGRQQHQMALGVCRDRTQELEALLPAVMRADAGVRLIDHHKAGQARAKLSRRLSALM